MHKSRKFAGFGRVWSAMMYLEDACRVDAKSGGDQTTRDAALYRREILWGAIVSAVNKAGKTKPIRRA